jgi:Family of unknown function (DUF5715)
MRVAVIVFLFVSSGLLYGGDRHSLAADVSSQTIQNTHADAANLSRMTNVAMIQRFARHGYLVSVPSSANSYYLHAIRPSQRYCRPWTKLLLERLSSQYQARFHQRLRVTSLVRTVGSQERLARRNENAAEATGDERSSHLTGATIDISKRWMSPAGQEWVREVLYSLREQGYVYAIEEFYQPTFHIMVYPNYAQYVKQLKHRRERTPDVANAHPGPSPEAD